MSQCREHPLRNLIITGLFIKIPITFFTAWSDTTKFWHMANKLLANPEAFLTFYPPPWLLTMNIMLKSLAIFYDPSNFAVIEPALAEAWFKVGINQIYITSPIFNFTLKFPMLLSDLIIGIILYHIVKERLNTSSANKVFVIWYFNPFIILCALVLGQNDILIALFMLISLFFISQREYLFSGISLGLSIFFKLYNAYVLLLFLLMILFELERESTRLIHLRKKGLKNVIKFLGGFTIPFLLLLPSLKIFGSIFGSWLSVPRLSGFNIWGVITLFPYLQIVDNWAYSNFYFLQRAQFILGLFLVIIISFVIITKKGDYFEKLLYGVISMISITFLTATLANPHQIVSIFPFLALVNVLYEKWNNRYWLLSLAGLGYISLSRGPYPLLFPLGEFTSVISIQLLAKLTIIWASMKGIFNQTINFDFMLLFSTIGFSILLSFLFFSFEKTNLKWR